MIVQENYIFYPEKLPSNYSYSFPVPFEEINFETDDKVIINGLLFKVKDPKGVVFYLHGNAGSLNSWGHLYEDFTVRGYDVLFVDYRSYGKSTGDIENEEQLHSDARVVYRRLVAKYGEERVIVYGRSLGTGIATRLAAEKNPKTLILETPFFNFSDVAKHHFPFLMAGLTLKYRFENHKYLPEVSCPVYIFHGTNDKTIPYVQSSRLSRLSDNVKFYTLEGGAHNNLSGFTQYQDALDDILK